MPNPKTHYRVVPEGYGWEDPLTEYDHQDVAIDAANDRDVYPSGARVYRVEVEEVHESRIIAERQHKEWGDE